MCSLLILFILLRLSDAKYCGIVHNEIRLWFRCLERKEVWFVVGTTLSLSFLLLLQRAAPICYNMVPFIWWHECGYMHTDESYSMLVELWMLLFCCWIFYLCLVSFAFVKEWLADLQSGAKFGSHLRNLCSLMGNLYIPLRPSRFMLLFTCCCLWMLWILFRFNMLCLGSRWLARARDGRTKLQWRNLRIIVGSFFSKNISFERSTVTSVPCHWRKTI